MIKTEIRKVERDYFTNYIGYVWDITYINFSLFNVAIDILHIR